MFTVEKVGKCECKCRISNIDKHRFQRDLQVMDNMKFKVDSISVLNALPLPLKQKEDFFFCGQPHSGEQLNMAAASERNGSGQSLEDLLDNEGTTAGALVLTAFMTTATQPLTCVRLLMQVIDYKCQMTQLHFT